MTELKSVAQLERASSSLAVRIFANVAELADALGLGPSVARRESSSLSIRIVSNRKARFIKKSKTKRRGKK